MGKHRFPHDPKGRDCMRVELTIFDDHAGGLRSLVPVSENGVEARVLLNTGCYDNYISKVMYRRLEHDVPPDGANTGTAERGVVKRLYIDEYPLPDTQFIITPSEPAADTDIILGMAAISIFTRFCLSSRNILVLSDEVWH